MKKHWPIVFRGMLYFLAAFLPIFTEKIADILMDNRWPTAQRWVLSVLLGTAAGVVVLRAFYDGSVQRTKNENGNTTFITK